MGLKMIDKESGVILKDNPNAVKNGGATWAYEVAGQTMVCPIIIEELSPPGQMLVEVSRTFTSTISLSVVKMHNTKVTTRETNYLQMLCEEGGFFLEIADSIRGFGLTILKGRMEARDGKIWARFIVEVDRRIMSYIFHFHRHWQCCLMNSISMFYLGKQRRHKDGHISVTCSVTGAE
jgi:hypothetical protein